MKLKVRGAYHNLFSVASSEVLASPKPWQCAPAMAVGSVHAIVSQDNANSKVLQSHNKELSFLAWQGLKKGARSLSVFHICILQRHETDSDFVLSNLWISIIMFFVFRIMLRGVTLRKIRKAISVRVRHATSLYAAAVKTRPWLFHCCAKCQLHEGFEINALSGSYEISEYAHWSLCTHWNSIFCDGQSRNHRSIRGRGK
jgi:hypothetical protein